MVQPLEFFSSFILQITLVHLWNWSSADISGPYPSTLELVVVLGPTVLLLFALKKVRIHCINKSFHCCFVVTPKPKPWLPGHCRQLGLVRGSLMACWGSSKGV